MIESANVPACSRMTWNWPVFSLYLNCFVLVVQAFLKIPALNALAPQGNEPPFAVAQGIVLVLFVIAGYLSVRRFRPGAQMGTVPISA